MGTLNRFDRNHDVLCTEMKRKLKCILSIYCMLDPQIGYIQGMNYIAANILIALNGNAQNAFAVFSHLLKRDLSPIHLKSSPDASQRGFQSKAYCGGGRLSCSGQIGYGLRDLFLPSLPGLLCSLLQFEILATEYLPSLTDYFNELGIKTQNYASEWFLSIYAYILPINISLRLMDVFFICGWQVLHRAGLTILSAASELILTRQLEFDDILLLLKRKDLLKVLNFDEDRFVLSMLSFEVTNAKLHEIASLILTKTMIREHG